MCRTEKELNEEYASIVDSPFWANISSKRLEEALQARKRELERR